MFGFDNKQYFEMKSLSLNHIFTDFCIIYTTYTSLTLE